MANNWNRFLAESVYLYPSANATDKGNINSEKNIKESIENLLTKNFLVRRRYTTESRGLVIAPGKSSESLSYNDIIRFNQIYAVINGYYVQLKNENGSNFQITPFPKEGYTDIKNEYLTKYEMYYNADGTLKDGVNIKSVNLIYYYLVLKLDSDQASNNLKGDSLEYKSNTQYFNNLAVNISVLTLEEINSLKDPYIVLAKIKPSYNGNIPYIKSSDDIIIDDTSYSYLDMSEVYTNYTYTPNGSSEEITKEITLEEYIDLVLDDKTSHIDTISSYAHDGDVEYKTISVSVETIEDPDTHTISTNTKVTRYEPDLLNGEYQYNEDGSVKVIEVDDAVGEFSHFDDNYSIDDIQKRTHLSSESGKSTETSITNKIAKQISDNAGFGTGISSDTGNGDTYGHSTVQNHTGSVTQNNGRSPLLARADHTHDNRYLCTHLVVDSDDVIQTIKTPVSIQKPLKLNPSTKHTGTGSNSLLYVNGNTHITGNLTGPNNTTSVISGFGKVYNAVWNDYAELFKKENPNKNYEPGTVICKVPGKDTYDISSFNNRKLAIGVISDSYGHLLGGDQNLSLEENLEKYYPIALSGRVYVKVVKDATIEEGDLLSISAVAGKVTSCPNPEPGTIIGKALESSDGSKDKILMLVSIM